MWEKKQTPTLCRKCIHAHDMHDSILTCDAVPCVIDDGHCDNYEEKTEKTCENCGHHRGGDVGCKAGGCSLIRENWIPKQEQTEKKCINYDNADASVCYECENHSNYEPKQDAPESNVDTIENRDKIMKALAGLLATYGEQLWDVVADMQKNP
jgi:hypothetical protein